ncbi:metalloprotease [Halogeometricum borinquense]|uniref:Metalloprotease n=1 Tax=Halogeometricum borinquense TaxID=60847 RepID=A0A6C0UG92_9EURY|nr:metalloprotease [Halogeometricum borinquense]QIB74524.1 metalloprotease [Halogeometricum borinquense]QIQ76531.1 metalloprotease [Halogeometricum borinquense]
MSTNTTLSFSSRELRDLAVAWVALGLAFAIFFAGGGMRAIANVFGGGLVGPFLVSLLTAGIGFLLHELAHKVVAVRFGQVAEFRADYGMLFLAVMSSLAGFIFAAPGAVYHRGMLTDREHGLIALAGPVTNLALAALFLPVFLIGALRGSDFVGLVGFRGITINLFLAAFNMLPFGALDGKTVISWSKGVFAVVFIPSLLLTLVLIFAPF